jgi:hypothetical protein
MCVELRLRPGYTTVAEILGLTAVVLQIALGIEVMVTALRLLGVFDRGP